MSYVNLLLYSRVLPSYDYDDKKNKKGDVLNGDDPGQVEMFFKN